MISEGKLPPNAQSALVSSVTAVKTRAQTKGEVDGKTTTSSSATRSSSTSELISHNNEPIIVNEVLCYVSFYRNKSTIETLRRTVQAGFTPSDISHAKKIIVKRFQTQLALSPLIAERRNSSVRLAHEAEFDDIVGIMDLLDATNDLSQVQFVALNLDILPKFGPEELNVASVVERQVRVEQSVKEISEIQQSMFVDMQAKLEAKLDSFASTISAGMDKLYEMKQTVSNTFKSPVKPAVITQHPPETKVAIDRSSNLVVFGISENTDATIWRQKVDDVLEFLTGGHVDVLDMFRMGSYQSASTRSRPILVKLRVAWDKRIILMRSSNLKNYCTKGIYVAPDEPPEIRRQHTFDRMKRRAERNKKEVSVKDNVLYIDGAAVFSLVEGLIKNNNESV